jgi:hypothetical protein
MTVLMSIRRWHRTWLIASVHLAALVVFSHPGHANPYDGPVSYVVTKQAGDPNPTIQAPSGTWPGYIADTRSAGSWLDTQELVFEFETPDYFSTDNYGHWAVAIRADGQSDVTGDGKPNLRGRGVIFGNATFNLYTPDDFEGTPFRVFLVQ